MDANSSRPRSSGHAFNEKLSEKLPSGLNSPNAPVSSNYLSIDTQAVVLRNGAYDSPATASRSVNGQPEEIVRSQHFTLRTLPGMFYYVLCLFLPVESPWQRMEVDLVLFG